MHKDLIGLLLKAVKGLASAVLPFVGNLFAVVRLKLAEFLWDRENGCQGWRSASIKLRESKRK